MKLNAQNELNLRRRLAKLTAEHAAAPDWGPINPAWNRRMEAIVHVRNALARNEALQDAAPCAS